MPPGGRIRGLHTVARVTIAPECCRVVLYEMALLAFALLLAVVASRSTADAISAVNDFMNLSIVRIPLGKDGASGPIFDGLGGLSAGAGTRLLVDYREPQRSWVLDYLFKPSFGAALQVLKIEIGGTGDSTIGTEDSHERTRGHINMSRGYELWFAQVWSTVDRI